MSTTGSCSYCLSPLSPEEPRAECPECQGHYHVECWDENGGCATFGCAASADVVANRGGVAPAARVVGGTSVAGGAVALAPANYCDQCGVRVLATDTNCSACGSALY